MAKATVRGRLLNNTIASVSGTVLINLIGFAVLAVTIRRLGPLQFGLFSLLSAFSMGGYVTLLEMGLSSSVTKYVAQYFEEGSPERAAKLIVSSAAALESVGLLLAVLGWALAGSFASWFHVPAEFHTAFTGSVALIVTSYVFQFPLFAISGAIRGLHRVGVLKWIEVTMASLRSAAMIVVVLAGGGVLALTVVTFAAALVQFTVTTSYLRRIFPALRFNRSTVSLQALREVWGMTRLVFIGQVCSLTFRETDRVIIGLFLGPRALAAYEVATRIPSVLKTLMGQLNAAMIPVVSAINVAASSRERLARLFTQGTRYQMWVSVPILSATIFFTPDLLVLLAGSQYHSLAPVMRLALLVNLFGIIFNLGSSMLLGMNHRLRETTMLSLLSAVVNLALTLMWIEDLGIFGVLLGSVVSVALVLPLNLRIYLEEFDVDRWPFLRSLGLAAVVVTAVWLAAIAVGGPLVGGGLYRTVAVFALWSAAAYLILGVVLLRSEDRALVFSVVRGRRPGASLSHS